MSCRAETRVERNESRVGDTVEQDIVCTSRKPQDGVLLCRRHSEAVWSDQSGTESVYACGRMIGSDLTPQLRPEAHYQIDSADRGSRFPTKRRSWQPAVPAALLQEIKFQIGVRC